MTWPCSGIEEEQKNNNEVEICRLAAMKETITLLIEPKSRDQAMGQTSMNRLEAL